MNLNVKRQIAELRKMPAAQLREKHQEVFGKPSRSGHREYLFRRIAWKLQALAEGDLSERARRRAADLARNADLRISAPRAVAEATPGPDRSVRSGSLPVAADERLPMPGGEGTGTRLVDFLAVFRHLLTSCQDDLASLPAAGCIMCSTAQLAESNCSATTRKSEGGHPSLLTATLLPGEAIRMARRNPTGAQ